MVVPTAISSVNPYCGAQKPHAADTVKLVNSLGNRTTLRVARNHMCLLKNSIAEKCSEKLCARMPYKRRSQFSGHFLSPHFGAFHTKLEFFNRHRRFHSNFDCFRSASHRIVCLEVMIAKL